MKPKQNISLFNKELLLQSSIDSFKKLNPSLLIKNPVIFIVAIGAFITTILVFTGLIFSSYSFFNLQIAIWLWATVLFANFSEAIAEGKGKARQIVLETVELK